MKEVVRVEIDWAVVRMTRLKLFGTGLIHLSTRATGAAQPLSIFPPRCPPQQRRRLISQNLCRICQTRDPPGNAPAV